MLRALSIRHLAIIDTLDLEFGDGLSVLSGETGAGKSILIDALGLVLGDRADAGLIRTGHTQAEVSAEFAAGPAARAWLREQAMEDAASPDTVLLRRTVGADGRSRAFVNGASASLANLRELGERLVEIHGQNEHQRLLRAEAQRELLDESGGLDAELNAVGDAAARYADAAARIEQLKAAAGRDPAQLDYLRHQLRELAALKLEDGELEQLAADHKRMAHAGRLMDEGGRAQEQLYGADQSLYEQLSAIRGTLTGLAELDAAFTETEQLLGQALVPLREAADHIARTLDRLDLDPERLAEAERRLADIHELARKHRVRPEELTARLASLEAELELTERAAGDLEKVEAERTAAQAAYRPAAQKLSAARRKAAATLSAKVTATARELGMPKAEFRAEVVTAALERPRAAGDDDVRFDFTANPGQPARPLAKVASGGELSRVSLAIQLAVQHARNAAALVFDEVDAGVGGATAETVGVKLRQLGARRQVLCVTHLPQVAAQGQHHYAIRKEVRAGVTLTFVTKLDTAGRVAELARMLGGREVTKTSEAHASDMLRRAAKT